MSAINSLATPAWASRLKVISVKCRGCERSLALRQFSARKAGIKMRDAWYCSSACFTAGAEQEFSNLMKSGTEPGNHTVRMPLGLFLVSRGLLTSAQLREATDEQKEAGGEVGEILVRRGFVTERQVTSARAMQWGCPVFAMPKHLVQSTIQVPSTFIKLYSAVPLHYIAATKLLLMGFVHGVEYGLLYAIEQMTGSKTQPCFVTPTDFRAQMNRQEQAARKHEESAPREVKFEDLQSPAEMAQTLCGYGVDLEADEAVIGKCKDYLWARLTSGAREVDLLFNAG